MEKSDDSLEIVVSMEELERVIQLISKIVTEGEYTVDWTYSPRNVKNEHFRKKYICGEEEYKTVLSNLNPLVFYEAEKNNSPKARRDANAAKEIMYKFIVKEKFVLKEPIDIEESIVNVYVKITFPNGIEDSLIIVSFHESRRTLEEELENKMKKKNRI